MADRFRCILLPGRGWDTRITRLAAGVGVVAALLLGVGLTTGEGLGHAESPRGLAADEGRRYKIDASREGERSHVLVGSPAARSHGGFAHSHYVFMQIPVGAVQDKAHLPVGLDVEPASDRLETGSTAGARIVALDLSDPEADVVNLTAGFTTAGRPDLSFDARRILFVGKRGPADPLSVWEMNIDGSAPRQVTTLPGGCDEAIYLSTIYTIDAQRPVYQIAFRGCGTGFQPVKNRFHSSLYTCRLDGSRVRRITFSPHGVFDPYLLSDGRLLIGIETHTGWKPVPHEGWKPVPHEFRAIGTALYTLHVDGTELFPFAGVHEARAVRSMPCETPDGWIVYVESAVGSTDRGGSLMAVARTRSLRTRRLITDDAEGVYHSPSPMPDGDLLVSYRFRSSGTYGLYVLDPRTGNRTAKVFDSPRWHEVDAVAVVPRPEPAGRSSVVNDRVDTAQLYCLDAYISDTPEGKRIERPEIKRLRVIRALTGTGSVSDDEALPSRPDENRYDGADRGESDRVKETVLGEIPVEKDGSFFLELPARTPLRLETLGDAGEILQAMQSWIWLMPSERRGCIGCHEDRELTPPNRHVMALRKRATRVGVSKRDELMQDTKAKPTGVYGR